MSDERGPVCVFGGDLAACFDHCFEVVAAEEYAVSEQAFDVECPHCGGKTSVKFVVTWGGGGREGDVPVLGTTPVDDTAPTEWVKAHDVVWTPLICDACGLEWRSPQCTHEKVPSGTDPLAHLSPADRESARRLNEALQDDEGRETQAAARFFRD